MGHAWQEQPRPGAASLEFRTQAEELAPARGASTLFFVTASLNTQKSKTITERNRRVTQEV